MKEPVRFYMGRFYALDNFSAFELKIFRFESIGFDTWFPIFKTAEHAYQYAKFTQEPSGIDLNDPQRFERLVDFIKIQSTRTRVQNAISAHVAKQIANEGPLIFRPDWDLVKLQVMEEILRAKFDQHEYVRKVLKRTEDREIIEDSPTDSFWGRGPNHDGQNHMGKLWMKIRAEKFG